MPLVDYGSESEPDEPKSAEPAPQEQGPSTASRKRKQPLPSLPKAFESASTDDPALHQGRKRTRPFVEGDYDTHIYLSLSLSHRLAQEIKALEDAVRPKCPEIELHSFLDKGRELHVSLTHSFPLRRHQIPQFQSRLTRDLEASRKPSAGGLQLSLGGRVKVYYNGKRYGGEGHGGRAFLALQVTAGSREINALVDRVIHPLLKELHRPLYHANPEYHASFAWCLTDKGYRAPPSETAETESLVATETEGGSSREADTKPEREPIPADVVSAVNSAFERKILDAMPTAGWSIQALGLKTGKEVHHIQI